MLIIIANDRKSREVVDKHAPLVIWKQKVGTPSWLDSEYKKNRALRRKLERTWKRDKTSENQKKYSEQKEKCTQMALSKQTEHYAKILHKAGNCQKTLFKIANELLDKNSDRVFPTHTDSKKLANELNHFYDNKVKKICKSIPVVKDQPTHYARPFQGERLNVFEPTTEDELSEIIKQFGIKTSVEDPIPAKLIQASTDVLLPVYTNLVNKSLAEGTMETVKCSVIDPLLKKAGLDIDIYNHFCPVNNLIFFS